MTQPAPHYQPYQPLPPVMGGMAPPKPTGGGLTSLIAGVLALVVAGLAVGGSFAPVTSFSNSYEADGDVTVYGTTVGWWGYSDNGSTSPVDDESSLYGLGLVLVAVLVVLGAVFAFVASRSRASGPTTGGRSLITAGVGVLAGLMLVQSLSVLEQASTYNDRELEAGESLDFSAGLGLVLPLVGLALGLVAVVLAHVGQRQRAFRVEPNTPRMGFPAPYGYQGGPVAPGAPVAGVAAVGAQAVGAQAAVASPAVAAPPAAAPSEEEDNSGETTQVVSSATASGTAPAAAEPDSVSAALSGEAPATPAPPAPIAPPAPVAPPAPAEPVAAAPPAAPAAPVVAEPPVPEPPTATPASAAPSEPAPPASQTAPPANQPEPLSGLPVAPPAPELADEADKNQK